MFLLNLLEAVAVASSLSLDALIAGFAYGSNKIKVPFWSIQIINIICSVITGISFLIGSIIKDYIPHNIAPIICFSILFVLGLTKLLDSVTKSIIRTHASLNKEVKFSLFNFKFILHLYADAQDADIDQSKTLSSLEALSIAVALSLDGIGVGLGAALGGVNGWTVFLFSLITNALAIMLGCYIGEKISRKVQINLSWVSGAIFIVLAFLKL